MQMHHLHYSQHPKITVRIGFGDRGRVRNRARGWFS